MKQIVRSPARLENLLDLALEDLPNARFQMIPNVDDHDMLKVAVTLDVPEEVTHKRIVWDCKFAN